MNKQKQQKNESRIDIFKKMSNKVTKVIQLQKSLSVSNHYGKKKKMLKREKNQCLKEKKESVLYQRM